MKKTILLIGADGMFGKNVADIFVADGYKVIKATRSDFDITNSDEVEKFFAQRKCDFVIHTAAYTKVDEAENHKELAFLVNAKGAENVAIASAKRAIPIFYISTDYVFDGEKNALYLPSDKTNPINVYGASKLLGEKNVCRENPKFYIVRTSWLYGLGGKNFVDTMIDISRKQNFVKVINDQFGCPTWTQDLAYGIKTLIENRMPYGVYHICGSGITSWYEFAKKIFNILKINIDVIPVKTEEFPRTAKRPKFSAMNNGGFCGDWEDSLRAYLRNRGLA